MNWHFVLGVCFIIWLLKRSVGSHYFLNWPVPPILLLKSLQGFPLKILCRDFKFVPELAGLI